MENINTAVIKIEDVSLLFGEYHEKRTAIVMDKLTIHDVAGRWIISHIESGHKVAGLETVYGAISAAAELNKLDFSWASYLAGDPNAVNDEDTAEFINNLTAIVRRWREWERNIYK